MTTMYNVYEGKEHPTKEQSLKEREERGEERRVGLKEGVLICFDFVTFTW